MKKTYILLTLCLALMACNKVTVDFTYSPEAPRAGEAVKFDNLSSSGEDWEWAFGDGSTTIIKSPTHIYKRPGTYEVSLRVDKKNSLRATKQITIYDTIPTFVCADSTFFIFTDYTFEANVYNPYNYDVEYYWALPDWEGDIVVLDTTMQNRQLHVYFSEPAEAATICLCVILNNDTTLITKSFAVQDRATKAVLFRTLEGDYRQRIFESRFEQPQAIRENQLLTDEQDTVQVYNNDTFTLADVATVFPGVLGFHIAKRKIYYRSNGLWVANIDGANPVQIDSLPCAAMTLDTEENRIYWANENGMWYMPFIGSDNNKFVTSPEPLNTVNNVTKIAVDSELQ